MARPRSFDEDSALDAATTLFWLHGYDAASVRDLGATMGLGAASLYNAFGGKRALFRRCLDRYLDGGLRARTARLERDLPPRKAIETFLREILALSRLDRRGCLMVNSMVEAAGSDGDIGTVLREGLAELERFFSRCLQAGQRDGSIAGDGSPADIARLLVAAVMGLRILARARASPALLEGATRQALALLGPRGPAGIGRRAPPSRAARTREPGCRRP
jgi:TetR/AcrR family transcriptional repressor of nem operon